VWRIACRDYDTSLSACRSLTPAVYERVGDLFRCRFGDHAGWAHQLLFAAELQQFRPLLPPSLVAEMEAARAEEKEAKARAKAEKAARAKGSGDAPPPAAAGAAEEAEAAALAAGAEVPAEARAAEGSAAGATAKAKSARRTTAREALTDGRAGGRSRAKRPALGRRAVARAGGGAD